MSDEADPRDREIAALRAQVRLLAAQADALRAALARRTDEVVRLSRAAGADRDDSAE